MGKNSPLSGEGKEKRKGNGRIVATCGGKGRGAEVPRHKPEEKKKRSNPYAGLGLRGRAAETPPTGKEKKKNRH